MQFDLSPHTAFVHDDTLRRLVQSRHALAEEFRLLVTDEEGGGSRTETLDLSQPARCRVTPARAGAPAVTSSSSR